jgi:hypothetical protein
MFNDYLPRISASAVEQYLIFTGWTRDIEFKNKNLMVFDYNKYKKRIALPAREDYEDFQPSLERMLDTIALAEQRSPELILKDIFHVYFDSIVFRVDSPKYKKGVVPLDYAFNCINGLRDLVLHSACAEEEPKPITRASVNAKKILSNFNFAQTEIGSYIFKVDTQVPDEIQNQTAIWTKNTPEHDVVTRILHAMSQIDDAVKTQKELSGLAETAYKHGLNAGMCEALLKIRPEEEDAVLDASIAQASIFTGKPSASFKVSVKNYHFDAIRTLDKIYKSKYQSEDLVTCNGFILSLRQDETFRIATVVDKVFERQIAVSLSREYYKSACDAHRDGRQIMVSGKLNKSSTQWKINEVEEFSVIN